MVEKQRCTEKEKRLRDLLVINSGLKIEGGRWLDRRFDLESLDTEVLLVKVLKTLTDDRNKLMSLNETGINAEDTNDFSHGKNVSSELKRLFMKKPKFTNADSVREFILQMARTIIACNPNASVLSPDFTLLATNYGLSQDTANLQTQIYELKTENERIAANNIRLKQDNDSLTGGYQSLQVAYQDLLDRNEGGDVSDKLTRDIGKLRDELQTVQDERNNLKQRVNTLMTTHDMDMEKLRRDLQSANAKNLQRCEEEANKQKDRIRKELNDERDRLITQHETKLSALREEFKNSDVQSLRRTFLNREEKLLKNVDKLRIERNELDEKLKNLETQNNAAIAHLLNENTTIHNEFLQTRAQLDEQLLVKDETINSLKEELAESKRLVNELNDRVGRLNDELNESNRTVNRLNDELYKCLDSNTNSVQVLQSEMNDLLDRHTQELDKHKNELREANTTIDALKNELTERTMDVEQTSFDTNDYIYIRTVLIQVATVLGIFNNDDDENITTIGSLVQNEIPTLTRIFDMVRVSQSSYTHTNNVDMLHVWLKRMYRMMKEHEETEKVFEEQLVECENNLQKNKQAFLVDMQRLQDDLSAKFSYELQHITENNRLYTGVLHILTVINDLTTQTPNTLTTHNVIGVADVDNAVQKLEYVSNHSRFLENLINLLRKYIDNEDDTYTILNYNARKQQKFIDDIEQLLIVHTNLDWDYENFNLLTNTDLVDNTLNNNAPVVETTIPNETTTSVTPTTTSIVDTTKRRVPLVTLSTTPGGSGNVVKTQIQNQPLTESFSTSINKIANRVFEQYVPKEASTEVHERIDKMQQFDIDKYVKVKKRKTEYDQLRERTAKTTARNVTLEGFEGGEQSLDEDEEARPSDLEFVDDEEVELTRDVIEKKRKYQQPNTSKLSTRVKRQFRKLRKSRDKAISRNKMKVVKRRRRTITDTSTEEENEIDEMSIVNTVV